MTHTPNPPLRSLARCLLAIATAAFLLLLTTLTPHPALATTPTPTPADITVYRDPNCRCCEGWMEHLTAAGFQPHSIPTEDMEALKQQQGIPDRLTSCHTAMIDGYRIEGHVLANDIQRLLTERPNLAGIAVPGMPMGTPGMETEDQPDDFTVYSFDRQGNTATFNEYRF